MSMTDLNKIQKFLATTSVKCFWFPGSEDGKKFSTPLGGDNLTFHAWYSQSGASVTFASNPVGKLVGRIRVYNATTQTGSDLADIEVFEEWLKKVTK